MHRGKFIVLEGNENVGKTLQAGLLSGKLDKLGISNIVSREPGGTYWGEKIRSVLLNPDQQAPYPLDPVQEAMLFFTCRREFVNRIVVPHLEKDVWVIADRFALSTEIYQGLCQGVSPEILNQLYKMAVPDMVKPNYLILDITADESLRRDGHPDRVGQMQTFELKGQEFRQQVRDGYLRIAEERNLPVINAMQTPERVHDDILASLKSIRSIANQMPRVK